MKKNRFLTLMILFTAALVLSACAEAKPPYYGGFLKNGRELVEIPQVELFETPRDASELGSLPAAADTRPVVLLWYPDVVLADLVLMSIETRDEVRYNAKPQDEGVLEIQPAETLPLGAYCLVQGDPLAVFLQAWCFEVGGRASSSGRTNASQPTPRPEFETQLQKDLYGLWESTDPEKPLVIGFSADDMYLPYGAYAYDVIDEKSFSVVVDSLTTFTVVEISKNELVLEVEGDSLQLARVTEIIKDLDKKILGTWQLAGDPGTMTFTPDGKMSQFVDNQEILYTYQVVFNLILVKSSQVGEMQSLHVVSISNDKMTTSAGGQPFELIKIK